MAEIKTRADIARGRSAVEAERFAAGVTALSKNTYLTNLSVGYSQDWFIADAVAPRVMVPEDEEVGKYWVWGREAFYSEKKTGDTLSGLNRPLRGSSKSFDAQPSDAAYECEEYALNFLIDDREARQAAQKELALTDMVNQALSLDREVRVASLVNGTNFSNNTTLSGTDQWSDYTNSDPLGDIETAHDSVQENAGVRANIAFMNSDVYKKLRRHPDVREMFKVQQGSVSDDQLRQLIDVDQIHVGLAIYDNSNEGAAFSGARVWPSYFGLMYNPPNPGLYVPATMYQIAARDRGVMTDRINTRHSNWYEVSELQDEVFVSANTAYLIIDAVA